MQPGCWDVSSNAKQFAECNNRQTGVVRKVLTSIRLCRPIFLAAAARYSRSLLGSTAAMSSTASAPYALALNS